MRLHKMRSKKENARLPLIWTRLEVRMFRLQKMRLWKENARLRKEDAEAKAAWRLQKEDERLKKENAEAMAAQILHKAMLERAKRDKALMARLSDGIAVDDIVTLLFKHHIKFLVSGLGHEVPISYLEGKVVALFFCGASTSDNEFIELAHMYKQLKLSGENFELVFVCVHRKPAYNRVKSPLLRSCQQSVEKRIAKFLQGNTWLALPFSQRKRNYKLYKWVLSLVDDCYGEPKIELVIIEPGDNIAHLHARDIYQGYGIKAYPFSKSRVTELEVARLKSLTLDEVLFSGADEEDEKFVYDQDGQKISPSYLVGKNVVLFFITQYTRRSICDRDELIYGKMIDWYNARKRKDEAFEMIRVFYNDNDPGSRDASYRYYKRMPWLEFPYEKYDMGAWFEKLLKGVGDSSNFTPMFAAFGRHGRFITMKKLVSKFGEFIRPDFFDDGCLYAVVRDCIANDRGWKDSGFFYATR